MNIDIEEAQLGLFYVRYHRSYGISRNTQMEVCNAVQDVWSQR
jgi:hypothetical protein